MVIRFGAGRRRLTWRATSLWQDGGPQSRSLTVVDAGYGVSSLPEDAEVWRRLAVLLPGVTGAPR